MAVVTFSYIALEGKKDKLKAIPRWKDNFKWIHLRLKTKDEEEKNEDFSNEPALTFQ